MKPFRDRLKIGGPPKKQLPLGFPSKSPQKRDTLKMKTRLDGGVTRDFSMLRGISSTLERSGTWCPLTTWRKSPTRPVAIVKQKPAVVRENYPFPRMTTHLKGIPHQSNQETASAQKGTWMSEPVKLVSNM